MERICKYIFLQVVVTVLDYFFLNSCKSLFVNTGPLPGHQQLLTSSQYLIFIPPLIVHYITSIVQHEFRQYQARENESLFNSSWLWRLLKMWLLQSSTYNDELKDDENKVRSARVSVLLLFSLLITLFWCLLKKHGFYKVVLKTTNKKLSKK